ncbi:MAG TPA: hypothetical protein VEI52_01890 [Terriglobales bacterium]|nr:hypothetical protein [Terriglobales bacterium]
MEITIYRRHWAGCKHKDDRYHPRCGCSLWFQFNWSGPNTTLDGNKLHRGQNNGKRLASAGTSDAHPQSATTNTWGFFLLHSEAADSDDTMSTPYIGW